MFCYFFGMIDYMSKTNKFRGYMRQFLLFLMFILSQNASHAAKIDEAIDKIFAPVSDILSGIVFYPVDIFGAKIPITILWILLGGFFFTVFFRFIPIWGFKHSLNLIVNSKNNKDSNSDGGSGEVSSFQALATALSGTLGLGSIAGVAVAISIGGPGATFWILVGAILGMSLKFAESSLAVKHRRFNEDGTISGGPMHYIAFGLTKKGKRKLGQFLAIIFAVFLLLGSLGGGNMFQSNQACQQIIHITGDVNSIFANHVWICGLAITLFVGLTVIGGIKSIAKVTEKIVPFMCLLYILLGGAVICAYFTHIPEVILQIIKEAFVPDAIYGGVAGTIIIGLRRSVQSNEAGTGSAPIAYATVKTKEPISQGMVSLLEPFISGCMCTLTALVIILTESYRNYTQGISGIEITSSAFSSVIPHADYVLSVVIILFAVSTIISWAYYGQKGWTYLFGEGRKRILTYQFIFCSFIIIGSSMNLRSIVDFTDAGMLAMSVPNLIAIYFLLPELKEDLKEYCQKHNLSNKLINNWFKFDQTSEENSNEEKINV